MLRCCSIILILSCVCGLPPVRFRGSDLRLPSLLRLRGGDQHLLKDYIKLCDFGLAKKLLPGERSFTLYAFAPVSLQNTEHTLPC